MLSVQCMRPTKGLGREHRSAAALSNVRVGPCPNSGIQLWIRRTETRIRKSPSLRLRFPHVVERAGLFVGRSTSTAARLMFNFA
jgi:hypothetical protein